MLFFGKRRNVPLGTGGVERTSTDYTNATNELSQRHGLRLLEKVFKRTDTYCLVAQLCFWTEQMKGKIQYMEESS